jgi:hypothetical protein
VSLSDNFNRSNETALNTNNWGVTSLWAGVTLDTFQVKGNGSNSARLSCRTDSWGDDHSSQLTIKTLGTDCGGPAVRVQANGDCLILVLVPGSNFAAIFFVVSGGGFNNLVTASGTTTFAVNDVWKLEAVGDIISLYQNGNLVASRDVTEATTELGAGSGGTPGIFAWDGTSVWDDWVGTGEVGGGGGNVTKVMESFVTVTDTPITRILDIHAYSEILPVSDELVRYARLTRLLGDDLVMTDELLRVMLRVRLEGSGIVVTDELIKALSGSGVLHTQVLTSALLLTDEVLTVRMRERLQEDPLAISDGTLMSIMRMRSMDSTLTVVDELVRWAMYYRLSASGIDLFDEVLSQISSANFVTRVLTSNLVTADEVLKAYLLVREMTSNLDVADEVIRLRLWFKVVQEDLNLTDELVRLLSFDTQADPVFIVGHDKTAGFVVGGYAI